MQGASLSSAEYRFSANSRLKAAQFAFSHSLATQEASGKGRLSYTSAGLQALKTFCTRTLLVVETRPEQSVGRMKDVQEQLSDLKSQKVCTRKVGQHELPPGWKWSHGDAKQHLRHVVVRNWKTPGVEHSSFHSGLSMEDKVKQINSYATWETGFENDHFGWETSKNPLKRKVSPLLDMAKNYFGHLGALIAPSYKEDKYYLISDRTRTRLIEGENARAALSQGELSEELLKKAKYRPLSFQKKSSKDGTWQRKAEKVYLPCIGPAANRSDTDSSFVMFGLNLEKMMQKWEEITASDSGRLYYQQVSTDQNCSGMILSLLKAGGSDALHSINPRIYTNPDQVDQYSHTLQEKADQLNQASEDMLRRFQQAKEDPEQQSLLTPGHSMLGMSEVEARLSYNQIPAGTPSELKQSIENIRKAVSAFNGVSISTEELLPRAVTLVESMSEAFRQAGQDETLQKLLTPSLAAFMKVRTLMEEAYSQEHPVEITPREPPQEIQPETSLEPQTGLRRRGIGIRRENRD